MENKIRKKMPISERAKQFAPFSPLSGLAAELRRAEEETEAEYENELTKASSRKERE